MPYRTPLPGKLYRCSWCDGKKPIGEMRYPGSSKGKPPSTCAACRAAHPGQSWCDFHEEPHDVVQFVAYPAPRPGYWNICQDAFTHKRSQRQGQPKLHCPSCDIERDAWFFRGGRSKRACCRICEEANPGKRWCLDCRIWMDEDVFTRTGKDKTYRASRCRPCRTANEHGTTVAHLLSLQGATQPECAACGATEALKIDHDHACCPAANGCQQCVRGYLCHECNTAEGLLKTPERALLLAAYMEKIAMREGASPQQAIA